MSTAHTNFAVQISVVIIMTGLTYLFVQSFLQDKRDIHILWKFLTFVLMVAFVLLPGAAVVVGINWVGSVISVFRVAIIGWVFFQRKPIIIATVAGLHYFMWVTLELIAISIVVRLFSATAYPIVFSLATCLLMLLFIFAVRRLKLGRMDFVTTRLGIVFCLLMMVSSFVMLQFIHTIMEHEHNFFAVGSLLRDSIVVANVLVVILIESLIRQNEKSRFLILQKLQNETQQRHITQLATNLADKRLMSHDFRYSIEMIQSLFSAGKETELRAYLTELSGSKPTKLTLDTGNVMLDAILTSKKADAVNNDIEFILKMDIPQGLPDMSIEICTLLGNALDNAIEACERSSEKRKFIKMEISATTTQFLCRIVNTLGAKPEVRGKFLATSKSDKLNHGIGLRSMKQTCDNLGGDLSFEYDNTQFELQIYIPSRE